LGINHGVVLLAHPLMFHFEHRAIVCPPHPPHHPPPSPNIGPTMGSTGSHLGHSTVRTDARQTTWQRKRCPEGYKRPKLHATP
jgi:hypothetical protein